MQLAFDVTYTDPTTNDVVPWAKPTKALCAEIFNAPWKVCDLETTGLNPASAPQKFTNKDLQRGIDPHLRVRVVSVLYPSTVAGELPRRVAIDLDQVSKADRRAIYRAILSKYYFNHNIGFDAYWMYADLPKDERDFSVKILDSMLIARAMVPHQPLLMARLCSDETATEETVNYAQSMFREERGGWSLADLVFTQQGKLLDKDMQGPKNWCEPFLTQRQYQYATDDVVETHLLLCKMLGCEPTDNLAEAYEAAKATNSTLAMFEPQVLDVVRMRLHGMPWNEENAQKFVTKANAKIADFAKQLVELEPSLAQFEKELADATAGIGANLKKAIGKAFLDKGLNLDTTEATKDYKVGEKDLRKAGAQASEIARPLFSAWVGLSKAKKTRTMALEVSAFAKRSGDELIHPNTMHGPATGRLSSSEPNCQQFPSAQDFRDCVKAPEGFKVVASDFSALDVRVGAALAIRAQRQIVEAAMGVRKVDDEIRQVIVSVLNSPRPLEKYSEHLMGRQREAKEWRDKIEEAKTYSGKAKSAFWDEYRRRNRRLLLARFAFCLKFVRVRAEEAGEEEWGLLRNAFRIPAMDIHTWTALSMKGQDPTGLTKGLSDEAVAQVLKQKKGELGDARKTGKVGNLSLMYAMQSLGLKDAAAKNYDIHWSIEQAEAVRSEWFASYVEIDLWHAWTELNPHEEVQVPDPDRGNHIRRKMVYEARTLGNRVLYAFGLNAALSYEDQSSGADILGRAMNTWSKQYPDTFQYAVNQVHDEMVFVVPADKVEHHNKIIADVMVESANFFLAPFGVPGECSPAIGDVWLKD